MDDTVWRRCITAGVAAALMLPAAAAAKQPGSAHRHGHGGHHGLEQGRHHGQQPSAQTNAGDQGGSSHRGDHAVVAYMFAGTAKSLDGTTLTVTVAHANHHGRSFVGQDVAFDVSAARVVVRDVNGDGKRDLSDVAVGDRVLVLAPLPRDTSGASQPFAAKALVDEGQRGGHRGGRSAEASGSGDTQESTSSTDTADTTDSSSGDAVDSGSQEVAPPSDATVTGPQEPSDSSSGGGSGDTSSTSGSGDGSSTSGSTDGSSTSGSGSGDTPPAP